ncbi:hypothetical protein TCE0_044r16623 [Talaromyces pinophilus]|uniref:Xylanolytic transcriptional activator regulatory domain-containing protein n=1 Tax=Talaromyces pinophilus TaxID=128442 RepID=A0A478EBT9_TALPI|nr:hypothetical protein TCE0_044r16623 [Talaromyces pinophilus]
MHQLENMVHDFSRLDEDLPDAPAVPGQGLGLSTELNDGSGGAEKYGGSNQQTSDVPEDFMTGAGQPSTSQVWAQARSTNINGVSSSGEISPPYSKTTRAGPTPTINPTLTDELSLSISVMQGVALTKILAMLDEFSKAPSLQDWSVGSRDDAGIDKNLYDLTPSDIINVLATPDTPISSLHWSNSTLVRSPSIEALCIQLLDGKVQNESKTLPFNIILNFQAAILIGRQEELPCGLREHIELIKRRKFLDVLSKLDQITFRTPPSLHMLRAQCIGVVILQLFGNVPEAWSMMVAASRTLVARGYDTFQKNGQTSNEPDEDRDACIAWCYQLDRSMSLLLHRPPLLPKSSIPPRLSLSALDDEIKWKLQFIHLSLDLTHIQGLISFATRDSTKKMQWKDLEPLHNELNSLRKRLDTWEGESPGSVSDLFVRDAEYLRFRGYATQTILLQLSTDVAKSSLLQRVAVDCARKCFESFRDLTKDEQRIEMIDVSWDLLLYSLSPLCVLTYTIVRNRDAKDLNLLEDFTSFIFTRIIKKSPDNNPLATRIYNLYRSIIFICRPLISSVPSTTTTAGQPTYPTNHTPHRKNFMNFEHFFGGDGSATGSSSSNIAGASSETTHNQNRVWNAVVEGGTQIDDGIEDTSVTEERLMRLLMYRVKIGWSD